MSGLRPADARRGGLERGSDPRAADHGIGELDDLHVLEVPEYGSPVEIAARFGGSAGLRQAVEKLQELSYTA